jgi:hypothetical protein
VPTVLLPGSQTNTLVSDTVSTIRGDVLAGSASTIDDDNQGILSAADGYTPTVTATPNSNLETVEMSTKSATGHGIQPFNGDPKQNVDFWFRMMELQWLRRNAQKDPKTSDSKKDLAFEIVSNVQGDAWNIIQDWSEDVLNDPDKLKVELLKEWPPALKDELRHNAIHRITKLSQGDKSVDRYLEECREIHRYIPAEQAPTLVIYIL